MSAIENLFRAIFQIFEGILNAIFSVFQGAVGFTTSTVRFVLALFWNAVSFILHNIVPIGLVVALFVGYQAFAGRQRVGGAKKQL